jgi:hypothetical protein
VSRPTDAAKREHQRFLYGPRPRQYFLPKNKEELEAIALPPRTAERAKIDADIAAYLKRGGKIEEVPVGVSGRRD